VKAATQGAELGDVGRPGTTGFNGGAAVVGWPRVGRESGQVGPAHQ
jgi:hypothetical protein